MSHHPYRPGNQERSVDPLRFDGAPVFLPWSDDLLRRKFRRRALPLVALVGADESTLDAIRGRTDAWRWRRPLTVSHVPSSLLDDAGDMTHLRSLLDPLVASLRLRRGERPLARFKNQRRLEFSHYALISWLVDLGRTPVDQLPEPPVHRGAVPRMFAQFVEQEHPTLAGANDVSVDFGNQVPPWLGLAARFAPRLALVIARLGMAAPAWSLDRQLPVAHDRSFRHIVLAFARADPAVMDCREVHRLLVDAFLEDLRRAYRRATILGSGRRRTTHILLTLAPGPEGLDRGAALFLDLVSASRRDRAGTARLNWDPLLIVVGVTVAEAAALSSGFGLHDGQPQFDPSSPRSAEDEWRHHLVDGGANRSCTIPFPVLRTGAKQPVRDAIRDVGVPAGRVPATALLLVLALVIGMLALVDVQGHCGTLPGESRLVRDAGQCVGLAPERHRFLAQGEDLPTDNEVLATALAATEEGLHRQNAVALESEDHGTIVYLGILNPESEEQMLSLLEELRGLSAGQAVAARSGVPLQILFANGGPNMAQGALAAEAIAAAAESDPRLIGVVGLGLSYAGTGRAIDVLGRAKIPMVGTVLSATGLTTISQYYRQVGPTNEREVHVAGSYVASVLRASSVMLLSSDDTEDLYSTDLAQQARTTFSATFAPRPVEEVTYRATRGADEGNLALLARRVCALPRDQVVFFAGRSEDMQLLLSGLGTACAPGKYPRIVGGDDLMRFALGGGLPPGLPGIELSYVSLASSLVWGEDCQSVGLNSIFFEEYAKLSEHTCATSRDGSAQMAFDTVGTIAQAVRIVDEGDAPPTRQDVLRGLTRVSGDLALYGAASGRIDFGAGGGRAVPVDKAVLVLRATPRGAPPARALLCGAFESARPAPDGVGCPPPDAS